MSRKQQSDLSIPSNTVWPLNLFSDWFAHLDRKRLTRSASGQIDGFTSSQLRDVGIECMERSGMNTMFGSGQRYPSNGRAFRKMEEI